MGHRTILTMLGCAAVVALSSEPASCRAAGITWKKTVVEAKFRSEGVAAADVNKDGKTDVLIADCWYEAPSWDRHEIRKPKKDYGDGLHGYSDSMACWADDINLDGWADLVVVGFPGDPAYWYENPKGAPGHWPRHDVASSACNETPLYADLFGDGKKVLVMGWQPKGKDDEGTMAWFAPGVDPNQPWVMTAVSEKGGPDRKNIPGTAKFSHGLGVGDLNGDGRNDVITTAGWWEQPEGAKTATTAWAFHPVGLGVAAADMIAYDVNGDKKADIIDSSAHQFGIWWFEQGDKGTFTRHNLFPDLVSETHALISADIDGDGLNDLITGKRFWSHGRAEPGSEKPAKLYWFKATKEPDGKVSFMPQEIDDQSGIGTQFTVTDFNGDGFLDVVVANKKGVFVLEQVRPAQARGAVLRGVPLKKTGRVTTERYGFTSRTTRQPEIPVPIRENQRP